MRQEWVEVWRFETARLAVVAEITDCLDDPADSFQFPEDIESVRSGRVAWFDARVRVLDLESGQGYGADYLSCCAYDKPEELFRAHATTQADLRDLRRKYFRILEHVRHLRRRPLNSGIRARSIATELAEARDVAQHIGRLKVELANRGAVNPPGVYCYYGPDMVRQACGEARKTLAKVKPIRVRESV